MKQIIKNTLILFAITLVAGAILAVVYNVTKAPIATAEQEAEDKAFLAVCPAETVNSLSDIEIEDKITELDSGVEIQKIKKMLDKDGNTVGYAVKVSNKGYGGDIEMVVGVGLDEKITGFTVVSASNESPGLGANCLEEDFQKQYIGKTDGIVVSKTGADGNEIDAISGATITSDAVTTAVNSALNFVNIFLLHGGETE